MIFTTGLLVYHTNLIVKNFTTNEELKGYYRKPIGNPHSRTLSINCGQALKPANSEPSLMDEIIADKLKKEERKKMVEFNLFLISISKRLFFIFSISTMNRKN